GGLRHKMPSTAFTFLIGAAALAGILPLAGFFSKDAILVGALAEQPLIYAVGITAALLTAFYSFRAAFVPFFGKPRDKALYDQAHESPRMITIPLWILAFLTAFAGLVNLPFVLSLEHWLEPALGLHEEPDLILELAAILISAIVAIFGLIMAIALYIRKETWPRTLAKPFLGLQPALDHKWYVDEFYMKFIVTPLRSLANWSATTVDQTVIDGTVNGIGKVSIQVGNWTRRLENGSIPTYALSILVGVVALIAYFVFAI
ncbi:unnamed protein product, partial [marine sediment metagenome]